MQQQSDTKKQVKTNSHNTHTQSSMTGFSFCSLANSDLDKSLKKITKWVEELKTIDNCDCINIFLNDKVDFPKNLIN